MSSPIYSYGTNRTTNDTGIFIQTGGQLVVGQRFQNIAVPMITAASYMIDSAGGTTCSVTIEELGADGSTWRALQPTQGSLTGTTAPVNPIILTTAGKYSGTISGQFRGLRFNFTIATATVNYAELKGVITSYA